LLANGETWPTKRSGKADDGFSLRSPRDTAAPGKLKGRGLSRARRRKPVLSLNGATDLPVQR